MALGGVIAGTAYVPILPDLSKFSAAAQTGLAKTGSKLKSIGSSLTKGLTLPIVAAGAASVKLALDFDKTFAKIGALAGNIGEPMAKAKTDVMALAAATGQDPGGLANALYFTASAGLKASQVMPTLAASAKAAEAGFSDSATAAQLLTSTLNAYAGTGLTASKAMDVLTATIRVGKAEPADLADNLGTVITAAAQAKVSFAQVGAAIATATDLGVPAARAITGLRFLLSNISAPTAKAADTLKQYGISVGQLQDSVAKRGLIATMQGLAKTFDLNTTKGKAAWAAITGGARGAIVANTLVGKSADLANKNLEATTNAAGDFNTAVGKMNATPAVQMQQALSKLKDAAIIVGNALIPVLTQIATWVGKVATAFGKLSPQQQKAIIMVALFVAALGPLIVVIGAVVAAINPVTLAIVGLIAVGVLIIANWRKVEAAAGHMVAVVVRAFRAMLTLWLTVAGGILHGAAVAFGWIPGIGKKLHAADAAFTDWKNKTLASLEQTAEAADRWGTHVDTALSGVRKHLIALSGQKWIINVETHVAGTRGLQPPPGSHGKNQAAGFHGIVMTPTTFRVAEHGSERVDIQPHGSPASHGDGPMVNIESLVAADPRAAMDELVKRLRRTRALGGMRY